MTIFESYHDEHFKQSLAEKFCMKGYFHCVTSCMPKRTNNWKVNVAISFSWTFVRWWEKGLCVSKTLAIGIPMHHTTMFLCFRVLHLFYPFQVSDQAIDTNFLVKDLHITPLWEDDVLLEKYLPIAHHHHHLSRIPELFKDCVFSNFLPITWLQLF